MQNKPILIGFASAVLILVVAAASFFAGLSLGQRGYVANLQSQPQTGNPPQSGPAAGQPNPGDLNPQGGPPNAPSWPPDTMGRLLSLTASAITLDTPQGQVTVALNSSTKFINEAGVEMPSSQLQIGNVVAVFGKDIATTIMRLPAR